MATIGFATLLHRGRSGSIDDKSVTEYDEVYQVITDGPTLVVLIANAPGIPIQFSPYLTDENAILLSRTPRGTNDESAQTWEVTCHYSSKYDFQYQENPLDRPPRFSMATATFTKPATTDIVTGRAILNFAGDAYDPPGEIDDSRAVIMAVRNEAILPADVVLGYKNTINNDTWNGFAPQTVKLYSINSGEIQFENGQQFYSVTYEFHYREENWMLKLLEIGYHAKVAIGNGKFDLVNSGDHPMLLIRPPAGLGCVFTMDDTQAVYTPWNAYKTATFADLGLTIPSGQ